MTDSPLVRTDDAVSPPARRRRWLPVALIAVALTLVAGAAGWWLLNAREAIPEWDRLAELNLAAPAGDAFARDTPWVKVLLAPARPGEENTLRLSPGYPRGTPTAADAPPPITAVTARPVSAEATGAGPVVMTAGDDGALSATEPLDNAGWWRLSGEIEIVENLAEFYVLVPDPNLNGPNAVPGFASSTEGEAVFRRGLDAIIGLRNVRYTQWIADGKGNAAVAEHAVTAGGDGAPPAFTYRAVGGMDAVVIGSTRWIKLPGDLGWQRQEGASVVPPSEWGEEYLGAAEFTLLGEETIDGERCQILAFVAPELSEPRRRTVAWYLWWVGTETGHVRKEAMVSRQHYMLNEFGNFDEPLTITPPDETGTPTAATPVAAGTPPA